MDRRLAAGLAARRDAGLYRAREVFEGPAGPRVRLAGREYLAFCSNDYLGLAGDPRVAAAWRRGLAQWGAGAGAAHLVTGHVRPHHDLEEALADFVGRPRALLFSTGYMANLGVVGALAGPGDLVLEDRLNHASLLDAGLLSRARLRRYAHADPGGVEASLAAARADRRLVVTDGLFSMDGDLAPLPALAGAAARHDAWLAVDDAHGLGVLGAGGRGTLEHFGLGIDEVPILVGTLGKAFGTFGAFAAGSDTLIETLIQFARSYVYTTALPPALAVATLASLERVREDDWRRRHLRELVARFRRGAAQLGLPLPASESPIQPLSVGAAEDAVRLAADLREAGVLVTPIRPPTVPEGTARLRITFSAAHSEADVDRLLAALEESGAVRGGAGEE